MTSTKLSAIQIEALRALDKGDANLCEVRERIRAFGRLDRAGRKRGATMATLWSLRDRGFLLHSAGLGAMYAPEVNITFRITDSGRAVLQAMERHRQQ